MTALNVNGRDHAIDIDSTTPIPAVHAAWVRHDVAQCGCFQSGQIMSATAFLKSLPKGRQPSAAEIGAAMAGNLRRCGTCARIRADQASIRVEFGNGLQQRPAATQPSGQKVRQSGRSAVTARCHR